MKTPYKYFPLISPIYRKSRQFINSILYQGNNVICPLCENSFRSWIRKKPPHGENHFSSLIKNNPPHGVCPLCKSLPRHRLLCLYLNKHSSIFEQKPCKILHFAPEYCWKNKINKISHIEYVTADISAPEADIHTDITNTCFQDETFDYILCSHVLEHIPDDRKAINELYRILTFNGIAYIQIPYRDKAPTYEDLTITDPQERKEKFGQFDHVRIYGTDFQSRLEASGFQVTQVYFAKELSWEDRQKYGLWDDIIFSCLKTHKS